MRFDVYRVLRSIHWNGRTYCACERIRMAEAEALPLIESGHLEEIGPPPVNGHEVPREAALTGR